MATQGHPPDPRPPRSSGTEWTRPFDDDEGLTGELDLASARRPTREKRRVNVDFPSRMVVALRSSATQPQVDLKPITLLGMSRVGVASLLR